MQDTTISEIAKAWKKAKRVVVFTGAGMSTESGLPDFRSAQGMWKQRPESLATLKALSETPEEFYFFYQWRIQRLCEVYPNAGHLALALLEKQGHVQHLITQNVDGLHQSAGSKNVAELHGTLKTVSCLQCQSHYDASALLPTRQGWEQQYRAGEYHIGPECFCPQCKGKLRPDVVLFGEALPQKTLQESEVWSKEAELFVVIGSSLVVSPANSLPQIAVRAGAKLLIINQDPTPLDVLATWNLRAKAAEVLPVIVAAMNDGVAQGESMGDDDKETILSCGVEGGGLDLFRRTMADGSQQYFTAISSMGIDLNDNEYWSEKKICFSTWEDAWKYLLDTEFEIMYPIEVHPDFRERVLSHLAQFRPGNENAQPYWEERIWPRWQERCLPFK